MQRVKMLRTRIERRGEKATETYHAGFVFNVPDDLAHNWTHEFPPAAWPEDEPEPENEEAHAIALGIDPPPEIYDGPPIYPDGPEDLPEIEPLDDNPEE